ncbi:MAG: mechanosensitive ion channel [Candidatus Choladocola sp.]|nr:mechanosensitive ion channel [Candidatus Choladocola sp.]
MELMTQKALAHITDQLPQLASFGLKVLICIIVYVIGKKLIRQLVTSVRKMLERSRMQAGAITFTVSMIKILLYLVLILWIAMQFGLKESSVAALVASAGVAVGLALQGGLSNFTGGFLILLFQPFQIGDYIITQGVEGTVRKIEILYTTLHTIDNRRVIVPNGNLANNVIVNTTAASKRQLEIKIGISYQDSIGQAKSILENIIKENDAVLPNEETHVFVAELGESGVIMGLRCWVPTEQYFPTLWQMNEKIKNEFDRHGIHIPYPQLDIHVATSEQ